MTINANMLTETLNYILKSNAPVRTKPLGATKHSPFPGNLKTNGIFVAVNSARYSQIVVGGERAPYAEFTERTSHKKGWMKKSEQEFLQKMTSLGGEVK